MTAVDPATDDAPPAAIAPYRASITLGSVGVAAGFALAAAAVLHPFFSVPFGVLLGRSLFVSATLLFVFVAAQRVPEPKLPRWLPRWLFTVVAVCLAAPLAAGTAYLFSVGGRVGDFVYSTPRLTGFAILAGTALLLGLLLTLTAQLRQREAQARSQALAFELERSRLEKQAVDARLALLQAQIEPHFLFNTLANVQALVESGSPRAAPVLTSLIAYLRAGMPRLHDAAPTLDTELTLVRAYLELMQLRMPDRLHFDLQIDPALAGQRFPPLALLTLVENAVRHGIDPAEDGGRIGIGAARDADELVAWVEDTGCGIAADAAPGTGLSNLRSRLAAFYGPGATLKLSPLRAAPPHGLRAEIRWRA